MQLQAELTLPQEPAVIWRLLVEVARYREWNPFLSSVEGEVALGHRLLLTLGASDGYRSREAVVVTHVNPERELRWRGTFLRPGVIDTEFRFRLAPGDDGTTTLITGAEVSGWLAGYTSSRRLNCIARGCVGMNEALARRLATKQ